MEILDAYVGTGPDPQTVLDIFSGEWSSRMPEDSGLLATPGPANLFADKRISWLGEVVGGFEGKNILELGPLEAGHTYVMHKAGAEAITAVEANSRSYLKCLCIKEIFDLQRARFVYADAMAYTETQTGNFDLCVVSGLLYHMMSPIALIHNLSRMSNRMFIWTHYFEPYLRQEDGFADQFEEPEEVEFQGKRYSVAKRHYREALNWAGFCGGSKPWAYWLTRDALEKALSDHGFHVTDVGFDTPRHPNGPALALVAERR